MGHGHEHMMSGGMGWMGPLMGSILAVALFFTALAVLRMLRRGVLQGLQQRALPTVPTAEGRAREILAERFANGEIDSHEFMERASLLNWTPGVEPRATKN